MLPTYDPATHIDTVKTPYAVVHDMGINPKENSKGMLGQRIYEVVILVPLNEQHKLQPLSEAARQKLKSLPRLKYTGDATPTGIEAEFMGCTISLVYRLPVRIQ